MTVAPITSRIRGIPVEVRLGPAEGLTQESVVNLDNMFTIPIVALDRMVGELSIEKVRATEDAIRLALSLPKFAR